MRKNFLKILVSVWVLSGVSAAAQTPATTLDAGPQSLSQSIGNPTFVSLPNSPRTKPNFLDMGVDKGLQMMFDRLRPAGIDADYDFLEILATEKKVVLRNLKVTLNLSELKGTVKIGLIKAGLQDLMKLVQTAVLTFTNVDLQDVSVAVSSGKTPHTLKASAKTLQLDVWKLYRCVAIGEELGMNPNRKLDYDNEGKLLTPYGFCMDAARVFAATGTLVSAPPKEKYSLTDGLLNSPRFFLFDGQATLDFTIGKVNDKTIRTLKELKESLKP